MLVSLEIRDILIIDRLDLGVQPGLNVLTGETGAGKSILLDALGAVLGWKGRGDFVRRGADKGSVTAVFHVTDDHPSVDILAEAGIDVEDGEIIVTRSQSAEGRKIARINDRSATASLLRALGDTLVELHGQHDDRGLLDPKGHRALLDAFAGNKAAIEAVRAAWATRATARKALTEAEAAMAELAEEEDFLRHAVAEMDQLDPQPGEEGALDKSRRAMQAAEKTRGDVTRAHAALSGSQAAEGLMSDALRWLEDANAKMEETGDSDSDGEGPLGVAIEALGRAMVELDESVGLVEDAVQQMAFDPMALEHAEERLFAIRAMARKHAVLADDLGPLAESFRLRLSQLDNSAGHLGGLRSALSDADARYQTAADALSEARRAAAARLDKAMASELAPLKMERAVFTTKVDPSTHGPDGQDSVVFTVATNPGAPSGPLNKIASGGELSRFLLALKVCLTAQSDPKTMIFDEIDRGVGGATADAVGKRLAALAAGGQVLCVTHSPQVAALGNFHWRVEKRVENDVTLSTVVPLDPAQRLDEIARMLAGDTVTAAARAAAQALLDG